VGILRINTVANNEGGATMLRDALAALGDIDGKTISLDFRLAEGDAGRFPELAAALAVCEPVLRSLLARLTSSILLISNVSSVGPATFCRA
jgi:hypothetical protein